MQASTNAKELSSHFLAAATSMTGFSANYTIFLAVYITTYALYSSVYVVQTASATALHVSIAAFLVATT